MPGVSKEQIAQAREVDLLDYLLQHEPYAIQREGSNYRHKEHDSLVYSGSKKYWYWNSQGRSINALDYLMDIRGYGLVDAVNLLVGSSLQQSVPKPSKAVPAAKPKENKSIPFKLPKAQSCALALIPYLQKRGISDEVIKRSLQMGILFEARRFGEPVCVFVGKDDSGKAKYACVRGINNNLRKDVASSDKEYAFCYPPEAPGSRHVAVFEAPIDALSHASLQQRDGWKWNGYRLTLGGTAGVALFAFLDRHPEICRVVLHMDSDKPGIKNARRIKAACKGMNATAISAFRSIRPGAERTTTTSCCITSNNRKNNHALSVKPKRIGLLYRAEAVVSSPVPKAHRTEPNQ